MEQQITIRKATPNDRERVFLLYKEVASIPGGIARTSDEISEEYVADFFRRSASSGIHLLAEDLANPQVLVAEIHCSVLGPKVFEHILGDLTLVVHPHYHGKGIGRKIFSELLRVVEEEMPEILRVELIVRESNTKAIELYKKLGFMVEGALKNRIRNSDGSLEADIPMAWMRINLISTSR